MKHTKISADKVRIGQVRYFDTTVNASEIPEEKAYAFLVNINGTYVNPFNPLEEVPVYDRVNYTNSLSNGESYGTKIKLVNGEVKDGMCYILEKKDGRDIFDKEMVTLNDMKDYMLKTTDFFVDRMEAVNDGRLKPKELAYRYAQMEDDYIKKMKLDIYLQREKEKVKIK